MLQDVPKPSVRQGPFSVFETERLTLRRPSFADVNAIARLASDRRIAENTRRLPYPYSREHATAFVRASANDRRGSAFLIEHHQTLIGVVDVDWSAAEAPELGYWLGVDYWGQGFGTEAAKAAIDVAFEEGCAESLAAGARVANPASRNILEKCGFQWSGVELHRFLALGCSTPVDRFRLSRGVWSSLKNWRSPVRR